jgi:hypothetical protein
MAFIYSQDMAEPTMPLRVTSDPFSIVKSNRELSVFSCTECGRARLAERPSGTMCERCQHGRLLGGPTSSPPAGLANKLALQEIAKALRAQIQNSFSKSHDLHASWSPSSSSWKTAQISFAEIWGSTVCSENWPRRGFMANGECYPLTMWERRTTEIEPGYLLPTPTASDYGSNQSASNGAKVGPSLSSLARGWIMPTPTASMATKGSINSHYGRGGGLHLTSVASMLSFLLPTPTARDWKDGLTPGRYGRRSPSVAVAEAGHPGYLSQRFVAWMMGLNPNALEPIEKSEFPPAETGGYRKPQGKRSKGSSGSGASA